MYGKLAAALIVAGLTSMVMGYATFAYFTDEATSDNNVFEAGTVVLEIADNDEGFSESVSASWSQGNLAPGDALDDRTITVRDSGSVAAVLDIRFCNVGSGTDLGDLLDVTITYDDVTIYGPDRMASGDGGGSLDDFAETGLSVDAGDSELNITGSVEPHSSGDSNAYQGSSSTWEVYFLLRQSAADPIAGCATLTA